ncbi:uncharacterized protein LOC123536715 [Mercenaria mercenaria]|uniref:uncharacterized protein LOC123536715 n=1 Tax=Mercenaria mercenaria TaxID=6596 RepID=UPI00234E7CAB|nr:uncharacterized protein LOC123536715 [Mercenaria mercenaria]
MTDSKPNDEHRGFTTRAREIDSKIDPDFVTLLRDIETWNILCSCDIFGNEELIPVGSCVDGSKVTVPGDCGDMDVLMLSNKNILKEHLFDYDKAFPAFLRIRVKNEHQKYFQTVKDPIEGVYLPAAVLKEHHTKSSFLSKMLLNYNIQHDLSEDGKFLKVIRITSVGKEQMRLYPDDQNAFEFSDKPDMIERNLTIMEKVGKCTFGKVITLAKQSKRTHAVDETSTFATNNRSLLAEHDNTSLLEMFNEILDMCGRKNTDSDKTRNIQDTNKDSQTDAAEDGKSNAMQGTIYLDKKDNKTPQDMFSTDLLRGNAHNRKLSTDRPAARTKRINNKHKNKNATSSDPEVVKESHSVGACIKTSGTAKRETSFSKLKSIDFVPAFKIEGWPRVADEWVTRSRKWPSKEILKKIIGSGCQVVAKRPLALYSKPVIEERDPYFRLSFALSEVILAQNMKEQQLLCWRVLKAYQKCFLETEPKCLKSYHWKNVLFWVNEDLDESFWTDENVLVAVYKCLDFMKECLQKRNLPFYFVRRMNLLNGCDETIFDILREQVDLIRREPLAYLKRFISEPPKAETHFMDIEKIEGILSEETKANNIDRRSEDIANCFLLKFMYESDKSGFQFPKAILELLKKRRSEEDERLSCDPKDVQNSNSSQEKLLLDTSENIMESMKNYSKEGFFETMDLFLTVMDNVLNNEDGTDSDRVISQSFANVLSTVSSVVKRPQDYGLSKNVSNVCSSFHQHDGKELNGISFNLIANGAFAKLMDGIEKSTKNENKTFNLFDEIRKILQETVQNIGAITGR